jgi:hypothetical protein
MRILRNMIGCTDHKLRIQAQSEITMRRRKKFEGVILTKRFPDPKPRTKREIPRTVTSTGILNSSAIGSSVNAAMDDTHVTHMEPAEMTKTAVHLRALERFFGSSLSSRNTS